MCSIISKKRIKVRTGPRQEEKKLVETPQVDVAKHETPPVDEAGVVLWQKDGSRMSVQAEIKLSREDHR